MGLILLLLLAIGLTSVLCLGLFAILKAIDWFDKHFH